MQIGPYKSWSIVPLPQELNSHDKTPKPQESPLEQAFHHDYKVITMITKRHRILCTYPSWN